MLILTRRIGERLVIDDSIVVTILGAKGNQIRLGIAAPPGIEVHREEVWVRIQLERKGKEKND